MHEVIKGLAVVALVAALVATQLPYGKKVKLTKITVILPYLFTPIAVVLGFVIRPDEAYYGFVLFPTVGVIHICSVLYSKFS